MKETTFPLFVALEDEDQKYLGQLSSPHATKVKDRFSLCGCEDVQFCCCITAADFGIVNTDVHNHLLKMIIHP